MPADQNLDRGIPRIPGGFPTYDLNSAPTG